MSVISQFFPSAGSSSGGGGGGSEVAIGGGTTPVEIIGVSGGGGGGGDQNTQGASGNSCGGVGGMGAIFVAKNYCITPGVTYPIVIGSGGTKGTNAGPATLHRAQHGTNGGDTSFNNPLCQLHVLGGGGGGGGAWSNRTAEDPTGTYCISGRPGGTGGGAGGRGNNCAPTGATQKTGCPGGEGAYFEKLMTGTTVASQGCFQGPPASYGQQTIFQTIISSEAQALQCPWGFKGGFPGSDPHVCHMQAPSYSCVRTSRVGGAMGNTILATFNASACPSQGSYFAACAEVGESGRCFNIPYQIVEGGYIVGGTSCIGMGGAQGGTPGDGCPGGLWIQYPAAVGAATIVNGSDLSATTPGYKTYCFSANGSITIP